MTTEELNKHRRKGLYFKCNEKFGLGHVCKNLFMIQATLEPSDDDVKMQDDGILKGQLLGISLHPVAALRTLDTMRVNARLAHQLVIARKEYWASIHTQRAFRGKVTLGERLGSPSKCNQTPLILQGNSILVDFYLLPLERFDVVLGAQWLSTLGPIK